MRAVEKSKFGAVFTKLTVGHRIGREQACLLCFNFQTQRVLPLPPRTPTSYPPHIQGALVQHFFSLCYSDPWAGVFSFWNTSPKWVRSLCYWSVLMLGDLPLLCFQEPLRLACGPLLNSLLCLWIWNPLCSLLSLSLLLETRGCGTSVPWSKFGVGSGRPILGLKLSHLLHFGFC